jgi:hypothetical protein
MAAINSTQQLAKIRSQIDTQQQIIGQLEMELQFAILGSPRDTDDRSIGDIVADVRGLYDAVSGGGALGAAVESGVKGFFEDKNGDVPDLSTQMVEQDAIRHMLYQARALLGELRIEEQQWNVEAQEEKARKKELTDFAKA